MDGARATAPLRIDLAGGTLDIWPLYLALRPPAVTVNVALDLPARVEVRRGGEGDEEVRLASRDGNREASYATREALLEALGEGRAEPALLAHAVAALAPPGGIRMEATASSPPGAGLGGSSSLLVAALAALAAVARRPMDPEDLRRLAQDLEATLLGAPTGHQDYYPALHGGCLALEGRPGVVEVERLPVDLDALASRLALLHSGVEHASGATNWGVVRAFFDGAAETRSALEEIAARARDVRRHLRAGALDDALLGVVAEGLARRRLAPGVVPEAVRALDEEARRGGALGTKILGAGGGGCVLLVLPDPPPAGLVGRLARPPWREIPLSLTGRGLLVEEIGA